MYGTPKQQKYAKRIRSWTIKGLTEVADNFLHPNAATQESVRFYARRAIVEQDATFWIAHVGHDITLLLQDQERRYLRELEQQMSSVQVEAEANMLAKSQAPDPQVEERI